MNDSERQQMNQRFVGGAAMSGATLGEIAAGIVDPVKEMNRIVEIEPGSSVDSGGAGVRQVRRVKRTDWAAVGVLLFFITVVFALILCELHVTYLRSH